MKEVRIPTGISVGWTIVLQAVSEMRRTRRPPAPMPG